MKIAESHGPVREVPLFDLLLGELNHLVVTGIHGDLLEEAARELNIGLSDSALIGDSLGDILAARAMGVTGYGVKTGYGCADAARYPGGERTELPIMFASALDAARPELRVPVVRGLGHVSEE